MFNNYGAPTGGSGWFQNRPQQPRPPQIGGPLPPFNPGGGMPSSPIAFPGGQPPQLGGGMPPFNPNDPQANPPNIFGGPVGGGMNGFPGQANGGVFPGQANGGVFPGGGMRASNEFHSGQMPPMQFQQQRPNFNTGMAQPVNYTGPLGYGR